MKTLSLAAAIAALLAVGALLVSTLTFADEAVVDKNVTLVVTTEEPWPLRLWLDDVVVLNTGKKTPDQATVNVAPGKHDMMGGRNLPWIYIADPTNRVSVDVEFQPNTTYNIHCKFHNSVVAHVTECVVLN
jgi:hypothetical protein